MLLLWVLLASCLASSARADAHLALDVPVIGYRNTTYAPDPGGGIDVLFGAKEGVGLRAGQLLRFGLELGFVCELASVRQRVEGEAQRVFRAAPAVYARYYLPGSALRMFVGVSAGAEIGRAKLSQQEQRHRALSVGLEGGLRWMVSEHVSLDPFLRFHVVMGRQTVVQEEDSFAWEYGGYEDERDMRQVRALLGVAVSLWL